MLKINTSHPRALEWAGLTLILILAAILRLGWPNIVEFKRDEANLSVLTLDMLHGRDFPLLGIDSSVGIRNAPVNVYLMLPPYAFSSNPELATAYVGLQNVIAVLLLYALVRRYYGPLAAFIAALLYAVSPWAVVYSRKIWAQDMLPLFIILTIGTALLGFLEGKRWAQLLHLPLLAITGQIHYVAFVLIPITLYLIVTGRKRLRRQFLFSFGLTVLVLLPYAIGAWQASLFGPDTLQKIVTSGGGKPHPITLSAEALQLTAITIAGTGIEQLAGPQNAAKYLAGVPNVYPLFVVLLIAVILAAAWLIVRTVRCRDQRRHIDVTMLLWLLFTPVIFSVSWTIMYQHYLIPMLPAAFVVLGVAVSDLWDALAMSVTARRVAFAAAGIAIVALVGSQVWRKVALLNYVNMYATPDGFATPLGYYLPIRDAVLTQHPQNVLANLDGQYIGFHDETTVWNALLYDVPSVRFLDSGTEVYPAEKALYLSHNCTTATEKFNLRPSEPCYAITWRSADDLDLSAYTPTNGGKLTFSNGARITAYQWEPGKACLSVVWTINRAGSDDYQFAVHFYNTVKKEILFADSLGWRGVYWRVGDIVVKRFCLTNGQDRISEIAGVHIGMYTTRDTPQGMQFYGQDLLAANGVSVGSGWIDIPLGARRIQF